MIVISDGQDNQFTGGSGPSVVSPPELRRLAAEMATVVYPVVFPGEEINARGKLIGCWRCGHAAACRRHRWAVFAARSIHDLARVFPLLEAELQASIRWAILRPIKISTEGGRAVTVSVDQAELNLRVRPGYFAK